MMPPEDRTKFGATPEERQAARAVHKLAAEGLGVAAIARAMNASALRSAARGDQGFSRKLVGRILARPSPPEPKAKRARAPQQPNQPEAAPPVPHAPAQGKTKWVRAPSIDPYDPGPFCIVEVPDVEPAPEVQLPWVWW